MSTSSGTGAVGNTPPITFPGIVSGIDYTSIISELTSLTLKPTQALNAQITTLNNANLELININNLLTSVQAAIQNLSNPDLYQAYDATSTDSTAVTGTGIAGESAVPGSYVIESDKTATSTTVTSSASAGHSITDDITSGEYAGQASNTVPLADSYAAVTPTNGTNDTLGQITVDGVAVSYNVDSQSLDTILNNITAAVDTSADSGFLATLVGGVVEFTSSDQPISVGSASDTGNLLQVLRLSNAQVLNSASSGSIIGTGNVGGINATESFDTTTSAGFNTPVTAGFFTINGVKITLQTTESLDDIITAINSSAAGVVATLNQATGQVVLTAQQTGPQSIVLGSSSDTSNFLSAAGLTTASGAQTQIGTQSSVEVLNTNGSTTTYYGNSNTVTTAIPGIQLNLQSSTTTPFTITVAQNTAPLVSAIATFISAYNGVVNEINAATAPPIVGTAALGSGGEATSTGGGVLFGNSNVQVIQQQLTQIVSGFLGSGNSYNSLSQIGLQLDDEFSTVTTGNNTDNLGDSGGTTESGDTNATVQATNYEGTDGQLQALNVSQFLTAFDADPSAVTALLNGSNGLTATLGSYLTSATGAPTLLNSGPIGNIPAVSIVQNFENTNTDSISNLQQQVAQITDNANEQANILRAEFVSSESMIAGLQSEQEELAAALGFTVSSSSSSSTAASSS